MFCNVIVSMTGTPGTGKTTICKSLSDKYKVIHVKDLVKHELDEDGGYLLDVEDLSQVVIDDLGEVTMIDGHLSHHVSNDLTILLRCSPDILSQRLKERGYTDQKIRQNVEAEVIDLIRVEVHELGSKMVQLDTTNSSIDDTVSRISAIIEGKEDNGDNIDWINEVEEWF